MGVGDSVSERSEKVGKGKGPMSIRDISRTNNTFIEVDTLD